MLQNYLKTTLRHILKSKVNFVFKLGGLTLALSALMVIVVYVNYHLSFDTYHNDYKHIYRVNARWMENGALASYAIIPPAVGPALKEQFPEIETFTRIGHSSRYQVNYKERSMHIHGFVSADSTVFDILSFTFVSGDKHALDHPTSLVLTKSLAHEIFGDEDPMGKTISLTDRGGEQYQVSAIIDDPPSNTHLHVRAIMPYLNNDPSFEPWRIGIDGSEPLYVRVEHHTDVEEFVSKAIPYLRTKLTSGQDHLENNYEIYLQPIEDIHLDPWIYADFTRKGNVIYVYVFSLLGLFLLIIAGINYVNLSIADFHRRTKEIGVRKVLGAVRKQVAFQVIGETIAMCLISALLGIGLVYIIFPHIVTALDSDLSFSMLSDRRIVVLLAAVITLLITTSSVYPVWHLAGNKPIRNFRSISAVGKNSQGRILLLLQFSISVICIGATVVVGKQMHFFQTKDPGYIRENSIVLYMPDTYPPEKIPVIKSELSELQGVHAVSYSTFRIAAGGYYRDWYRVEVDGEMKPMLLNEVFFDHDFFRTTGIELVAGRNFDPANPADAHSAFIVNETAVREFGWDHPLGKKISYGYEDPEGEKWDGTIVGVVKDFNIYSMRRKIEPLVMRLPWSDWPGSCVHIRIDGPMQETLTRIKAKYEEILPDFLVDYSLIDDLYIRQYENEQKAFTFLKFGTWIIVLISALGIFSLSVYMSIMRMKEFGIRKVLGATQKQIAILHVGYFLRIAFIANIIALPFCYWLIQIWLSQFVYRTQVGSLVYVGVMITSFVLIVVSAGYASLRAGMMNPVEVIKSDN